MTYLPVHLFVGVVALLATVAVRGLSTNRFIARRLRVSLLLLCAYVAINLFPLWSSGRALHERLDSVEDLILALAAINLVVLLTFNPFREDRVSERFPSVVQDAITIAVFLIVSTVFMREKFLTTSAVSAVVLGFALQDTFGNMFAGLAIQVEKPFRIGDWVAISQHEGKISEITWRATKLRTKSGNFVVIPNNLIAKEAITNYSEPIHAVRLVVNVGASYDVPPNRVKRTIQAALASEPLLLEAPAPEAFVFDFAASAITYRVEFWIGDFANETAALDRARTAIYYAFRRESIEIPYPIQVTYRHTDHSAAGAGAHQTRLRRLIDDVDLFAPLGEDQRAHLLGESRERLYGDGERIVRQGDEGSSMFLVADGEVAVLIEPGDHEVARLTAGDYFGEMSMLTGEPRSATVRASGDSRVLEITADTFKHLVAGNPGLLEQISVVEANRRVELERRRSATTAAVQVQDVQQSIFARIQQFFRM